MVFYFFLWKGIAKWVFWDGYITYYCSDHTGRIRYKVINRRICAHQTVTVAVGLDFCTSIWKLMSDSVQIRPSNVICLGMRSDWMQEKWNSSIEKVYQMQATLCQRKDVNIVEINMINGSAIVCDYQSLATKRHVWPYDVNKIFLIPFIPPLPSFRVYVARRNIETGDAWRTLSLPSFSFLPSLFPELHLQLNWCLPSLQFFIAILNIACWSLRNKTELIIAEFYAFSFLLVLLHNNSYPTNSWWVANFIINIYRGHNVDSLIQAMESNVC